MDNSKKTEPASTPIFRTSLRYHLKPRPIEGGGDLPENRKARREKKHARRAAHLSGRGASAQPSPAAKFVADPKVQAKPEPIAGWITRGEARALLGIEEAELAALIARFRLRQSWVEVYSKPEILALREIVAKLR